MGSFFDKIARRFYRANKQDALTSVPDSIAFSCAVDSDSRFVFQAARLLLSLRWFGGNVRNAPFYLNSTARLSPEAEEFFIRHGGIVTYCAPFDPEQPHITSNKLRGLQASELENYQHIVLVDSDTIIVQDPSRYCAVRGIAAKIADWPTVDDELLRNTFGNLGIDVPERMFEYELYRTTTFGYFNSGVIVVSGDWRERFIVTWEKYCRELLSREACIEIQKHYIEQAALAATVAELNIPLDVLPASMNLPVNFLKHQYPKRYHNIDPQIIHYHWLSNDNGFIRPLPLRMANLRAEMFNARLRVEIDGIQQNETADKAAHSPFNIAPETHERPKVIVGSGWWCDQNPHEWALGADITRKTAFFRIWLEQVERYLHPDRIVITDSHSPLKPNWQIYPKINWIELDKNYGGPNDVRVGKIKTKLSGFTKSVINGAMYALCCDADYYVYVEQDCLIRGQQFLEHAIGDSQADIFLGQRNIGGKGIEGRPAAPMIQQSLIIVTRNGLERFIAKTMEGPETDGELSPEVKMERDLVPFDFIKIPFGRSRPIDFSLSHFFVQHLELEELNQFMNIENIRETILETSESHVLTI